MKRPFMASL